ncbi:hypothetical protein E2320_013357 [Naja naja]|nr:hypothetical protein E2320_013357 [Naja naja]
MGWSTHPTPNCSRCSPHPSAVGVPWQSIRAQCAGLQPASTPSVPLCNSTMWLNATGPGASPGGWHDLATPRGLTALHPSWCLLEEMLCIPHLPVTRSIQSRFLQSRNLNCIALCEVITSKDLQKHGNIWVCPVSDHVCTRFFFVYEDGQVGDANINTQDPKIQKEIMRVIGTQVYTN